MTDFWFYLKIGVTHILDIEGLDHFYFIISFCLLYSFKDWKKILGLVTAFTIGHCITLFISGLELITIDANTVELLIPITILLSCLNNFYALLKDQHTAQHISITYSILLAFGLIHGLGFSNYARMMTFDNESILVTLLGFNIGIELAQLVIVTGILTIIAVLQFILKSKIKWFRIVVNSIISLLVLKMMFF